MGKPILNDRKVKVFGSATGRIACTYHNGASVVSGYIVKQLGTTKYKVTTDGVTKFNCKLAPTNTLAASLTNGYMTITATVQNTSATLVPRYGVATAVISGTPGTGYVTGDTVTVAMPGGTSAVLTVAATAGAITSISAITAPGLGATLPGTITGSAVRVSQTSTSGAGTGALIDLTFKVVDVLVVNGGSQFSATQALAFTGVVGGTPAATVGTVDANGTILTVTVGTPSTGIYNVTGATLNGASGTKNVRKLTDSRLVTTDGIRSRWALTTVAGKSKLNTVP